jgi:hypothetical protein
MPIRILPTSIGYPDTPEEVLHKPRLAKILKLAIPVVARKLERLGITDETIYYEWVEKGSKNLAEYYSLSQFPYNSKKIDALIKKAYSSKKDGYWKILKQEYLFQFSTPGPVIGLYERQKLARYSYTDYEGTGLLSFTLLHEYAHAIWEYFEVVYPKIHEILEFNYEVLENHYEIVLAPWWDAYNKDPKSVNMAGELWAEDFASVAMEMIRGKEDRYLPIAPDFVREMVRRYCECAFQEDI